MTKLYEQSIVGELVLTLIEQKFRIEICDQDGGGLYLYAEPDGGHMPAEGWKYWVRLIEGNGTDVIVNFSVNIEKYIHSALELSKNLKNLES